MTAHQQLRCQPPLLSIVLAVGAVEEFLPDCLNSILGQPGPPGGIEVIAVDDAAPDGSGAILDERAAGDPRLRVIHLSRSVGPGPARMRGLAAAKGCYVWFIDPDDLLTPGSLAAVVARLCQDSPDLMLLDYRLLLPSGRTEPSPAAGVLAGTAGVVTLLDRPRLIERTMTLWSKVFARPFLTGLGVTMRPGVHEDVPVSAAALLSAGRIALLDRVCYLYRRRPGSFLATPSMAHFSIFDSYAQVFGRLGAGDAAVPGAPGSTGPGAGGRAGIAVVTASPAVRAAVFSRAISHYSSILASGLVPRRARRQYFARMTADHRRYRPAGYQHPAGPRGLKDLLIGRGAYWAYLLLAPLNGARVAARRALVRER